MGEASSTEARHVGGSEESLEGKGVVLKTGKGGKKKGKGREEAGMSPLRAEAGQERKEAAKR